MYCHTPPSLAHDLNVHNNSCRLSYLLLSHSIPLSFSRSAPSLPFPPLTLCSPLLPSPLSIIHSLHSLPPCPSVCLSLYPNHTPSLPLYLSPPPSMYIHIHLSPSLLSIPSHVCEAWDSSFLDCVGQELADLECVLQEYRQLYLGKEAKPEGLRDRDGLAQLPKSK